MSDLGKTVVNGVLNINGLISLNGEMLNDNYTRLSYIQNTITSGAGNEKLDTGWVSSFARDFKVEIKYQIVTASQRYCLLSSYNSSNHISLELNASNHSRYYLSSAQVDNVNGATISTANPSVSKFTYRASDGYWTHTCDGTMTSGTKKLTGEAGGSAWMFVDRAGRYTTFKSSLKIFYCRIWDDGVLVRNFIPVKRNSDNVIGLLDTANNVFYTNSSGKSGSGFIGG